MFIVGNTFICYRFVCRSYNTYSLGISIPLKWTSIKIARTVAVFEFYRAQFYIVYRAAGYLKNFSPWNVFFPYILTRVEGWLEATLKISIITQIGRRADFKANVFESIGTVISRRWICALSTRDPLQLIHSSYYLWTNFVLYPDRRRTARERYFFIVVITHQSRRILST